MNINDFLKHNPYYLLFSSYYLREFSLVNLEWKKTMEGSTTELGGGGNGAPTKFLVNTYHMVMR